MIFYGDVFCVRQEENAERSLLPGEGGFCTMSCSSGDTKANPVTLTLYSSPKAIPSPLNPLNLLNLLNPGRFAALGRYHNSRPEGPWPLSTQPAAAGGHNPQPRRGWPPSPLNLLNPLNPLNPSRIAALFDYFPL